MRDYPGVQAILVVRSALVAKIPQLDIILAVFRGSPYNERIKSIGVFISNQLFAERIKQSKRRIQGRTNTKAVDIKNQALSFRRAEPIIVGLRRLFNRSGNYRRQL